MTMQAMAFRDRNWKRLLTEIEQGCVVPIIGPELLKVTVKGREMLLHDYLAGELAERLEVDVPDKATLGEVVWACRNLPGADPSEAYYEIWDILKGQQLPTPEPLRQLAQIDKLQLFISTTFDGLMAQALNEVRFGGEQRTLVRAFRKPGPGDDVARLEAAPIVYHVFGQAGTLPTFVLTEEDMLEFGHLWQDQDHRPPRLRSLLQDKYLAMLGCSFPDWFARFMLCALKFDSLFERSASTARRGVIADDRSRLDQELTLFLSRCNTQIYSDGGGIEFIRELSERWREHASKSPAATAPTAAAAAPGAKAEAGQEDGFAKGSIFISYASEDRSAAASISSALQAAGIDVWFDRNQLETGDDYRAKILRNIEQSSFFAPVISSHVLTTDRRFFRLEWSHAIEESRMRPTGIPFLLPIVIDNTQPTAPYLPAEFTQMQWENLPDGVTNENFVNLCKRRIRAMRRQEVSV
jgi:hypothetical protein